MRFSCKGAMHRYTDTWPHYFPPRTCSRVRCSRCLGPSKSLFPPHTALASPAANLFTTKTAILGTWKWYCRNQTLHLEVEHGCVQIAWSSVSHISATYQVKDTYAKLAAALEQLIAEHPEASGVSSSETVSKPSADSELALTRKRKTLSRILSSRGSYKWASLYKAPEIP